MPPTEVKLLCNLPVECFEPRQAYQDVEVVTYGPADRMWVDGTFYPFDVTFDASTGCIDELLACLPAGFQPDAMVIYWPDQEPIPRHLEACPIPVIGIVSDYNLTLPYLVGLWPFFDTLLVDRQGIDLFRNLSFAEPRYFCQYTFKAPTHHRYDDVGKDLDIAFAGNLNPVVQRQRARWLERVRGLEHHGLRVAVRNDIRGEAYGRFLNRAWIGFNRSIRGEMNLRAFEVPACGAVLLMEEDNQEVREFFVPDEEVVLYNQHNFEDVALSLASDRERCQRIADAGHQRVQDYRMGRRLQALCELLRERRAERPSSSPLDCALGRGVAMLSTWARGRGPLDELVAACGLAPTDPRPRNALALALLREGQQDHGQRALQVLQAAWHASPSYVPAAYNLTYLFTAAGHPTASRLREDTLRRLEHPTWSDLDGPLLPLGFQADSVAQSHALATAARNFDPEPLAATLRTMISAATHSLEVRQSRSSSAPKSTCW